MYNPEKVKHFFRKDDVLFLQRIFTYNIAIIWVQRVKITLRIWTMMYFSLKGQDFSAAIKDWEETLSDVLSALFLAETGENKM